MTRRGLQTLISTGQIRTTHIFQKKEVKSPGKMPQSGDFQRVPKQTSITSVHRGKGTARYFENPKPFNTFRSLGDFALGKKQNCWCENQRPNLNPRMLNSGAWTYWSGSWIPILRYGGKRCTIWQMSQLKPAPPNDQELLLKDGEQDC